MKMFFFHVKVWKIFKNRRKYLNILRRKKQISKQQADEIKEKILAIESKPVNTKEEGNAKKT